MFIHAAMIFDTRCMRIYASLFEMTSEGIGMGWLQTHLLNPIKNMTCDDLIQ